jgi:DNA polymerase-1
MTTTPTLCLIDGASYLYRAFHALPSLSNAKGAPTGAIFGVANMLRRLLEQHQPEHVAVVFDAPGKNFRHQMYAAYKANRPPMPEELRGQIEPLHALIEAMGLPRVMIDAVEADDVIATLTKQARAAGLNVLISSGDKDLAQLVDDGVVLEDSMQDKRYDREAVVEKFGVGPELLGDLLALTGDKSDNIPGVDKVGPKTAARWLHDHGDLDGLIAAADQISGKSGENLRAALDDLRLSRQLVALKDDVDLAGLGMDQLTATTPDQPQLSALLREFGFATWLKQLEQGEAAPDQASQGNPSPAAPAQASELTVDVVLDAASLEALMAALEQAEVWAFDIETTSLDPLSAELVGLAFAVKPDHAWYVPLAHQDQNSALSPDEVIKRLKPLLEDPNQHKLGQNLKYDLAVLASHDIVLRGIAHDTMLQSYVLNATASRHDLNTLALRHLGRTLISYEAVAGKGQKQVTFDQVPVAVAADYAGEDAEVALALHRTLWPQLENEARLRAVYQDLELPLIAVLARMERQGVAIDRQRLAAHSAELAERLAALEAQAHEAAGQVFNLSSPAQLQRILFEDQGLPVVRKTPKGQPSTAEDVLQELAADYPLPALILDYRGLSKLKSTYTDRLPEKIHPQTGRIHTHYHQAVTATGRLSSSDPNLQNIPIRSAEGRRVRQAFIAPPGHVLLAADYSQVELRIMAHLSEDERLLAAFAAGEDIHKATAAEVFDTALDDVSNDQRRAAKAINFGLMYGMSAWGLARQLDLDRAEASDYIERYFQRYPGVKAFMEATRKQAHDQGYVETLLGRRLWATEIRSRNAQRRQAAERAAINAPMQGSAADLIKLAMIAVDDWLQHSQQPARLVMQVHDELVLEVAEAALPAVQAGVVERMQGVAELRVPLLVDVGSGLDWDSAH